MALVINTGTTIVTFLMVFLIQNTQNRDAKAIQLKLDELLRGLRGPRTALVGLEQLSDEELGVLEKEFEKIHDGQQPPAELQAEAITKELKAETGESAGAGKYGARSRARHSRK